LIPTFFFGDPSFGSAPVFHWPKNPNWAELVSLFILNRNILEFSMSTSVQGWRTKWFYIKDRKSSSSDKYGIAPFDASQELKKLASWDSPPVTTQIFGNRNKWIY
jgi:hypothetical protein